MCLPKHVLRLVKLFRLVRSSRWKMSFLGHFHFLQEVLQLFAIISLKPTKTNNPYCNSQCIEVLMHFLLRPQSDLMMGGSVYW